MILILGILTGGCQDSGSSSQEKQVFGSAARGGSAEAGQVWQAALLAWPKQGNLSILYGSPRVQAEFENWMDGRRRLVEPGEDLLPVFDKIESFDAPLIALNGAWGPLPDPKTVRAMAVRGMRKTLWADLRLAAVRGDGSRVTDLLVVMCNLPRVSHAFDGSTRGLLATIGTCDAIGWGMRDASGAGVELDDQQKSRIREASSWLDQPLPFGAAGDTEEDQRRAGILEQFATMNLPTIRTARSQLLD